MKSSETLLFIQKFTNHLARNKQIDNLCESRRKNETFTYLRALLSNRIGVHAIIICNVIAETLHPA